MLIYWSVLDRLMMSWTESLTRHIDLLDAVTHTHLRLANLAKHKPVSTFSFSHLQNFHLFFTDASISDTSAFSPFASMIRKDEIYDQLGGSLSGQVFQSHCHQFASSRNIVDMHTKWPPIHLQSLNGWLASDDWVTSLRCRLGHAVTEHVLTVGGQSKTDLRHLRMCRVRTRTRSKCEASSQNLTRKISHMLNIPYNFLNGFELISKMTCETSQSAEICRSAEKSHVCKSATAPENKAFKSHCQHMAHLFLASLWQHRQCGQHGSQLWQRQHLPSSVLPAHSPLRQTLQRLPLRQPHWQLLQRHQQRQDGLQAGTAWAQARGAEELEVMAGLQDWGAAHFGLACGRLGQRYTGSCNIKQVLIDCSLNPLPGATSENVRAGPRAERPKTSGRDRKTSLHPNKEISIQSPKNLVNNNSTRLSLLPPAPFALSLCSKRKWESFWKSSRRNALPVFETDLFDDIRQWWTILWLSCWRYCASRSCSRLGLWR